jgi:hypothetical protein
MPVIRVKHPLFSKADSVDDLNMIFEMLQVFENKPLRLAHGVATLDPLLWINLF